MTRASAMNEPTPADLGIHSAQEPLVLPPAAEQSEQELVNQGLPVVPPHLGTADRIESLAAEVSPLVRGQTVSMALINALIEAVDELRADLRLEPIDWGRIARETGREVGT